MKKLIVLVVVALALVGCATTTKASSSLTPGFGLEGLMDSVSPVPHSSHEGLPPR
jgi:hypothetical protein